MKVHEKAAAAHHRRPDHHPCTPYPAPEPPIPFPSPANAHNQTWLNKTCRIGAMRSSHIAEQLVVGHQVYTLEGLSPSSLPRLALSPLSPLSPLSLCRPRRGTRFTPWRASTACTVTACSPRRRRNSGSRKCVRATPCIGGFIMCSFANRLPDPPCSLLPP